MFKVSYLHMLGYRVSRAFDTREAAQEFIDVNAMVCPLPGVKLIAPEGKVIAMISIMRIGKLQTPPARKPYVYTPGKPCTLTRGEIYAAGMRIGDLLKGADPEIAREICGIVRHMESAL